MDRFLTTFVLLISQFACMVVQGQEWTPPKEIPARDIYLLAKKSMAEKDYEKSLDIHEWIFYQSRQLMPELAGIRRASALQSWFQLSQQYEPAVKSIEKALAMSKIAVRAKDGDIVEQFRDFAALSKLSNKRDDVIALFISIDGRDDLVSKEIFNHIYEEFRDELDVEFLRKYLDEKVQFELFSSLFVQSWKSAFNSQIASSARKRFDSRIANLASDLKALEKEQLAEKIVLQAAELTKKIESR